LNDDEENLFAFTFATPPEDSTGVTHIIEHSVLCGSENFPLKDTFLVLEQGSLQTYLNAWTFPDKTVYPASSVNEKDYFNLMAVYADAVFRPLLSEWTFMQEGHRLELAEGKQTRLSITGVVYNEMKGAYSSLDAYANLWSTKSLLPDTPYAFESGGDPDVIPELTFERFKSYHQSRYSPANCRIFLAGNVPTEKQIAFLDARLSSLPAGKAAPALPQARKWDAPRSIRVPCPFGGDQKASVLVSWLAGDSSDAAETMALIALSDILLGHDGSPLAKALLESGLGEDLSPSSGFEDELRQTMLCMGLRGVENTGNVEKIESLILAELARLVKDGIPSTEIEAAMLGLEFSNREIKRGQGPYSLSWLRRTMRGWLHGARPVDSLLFLPAFAKIKDNLAANPRYFEALIQKYLLDNSHRCRIVIEPEEGFLEKKEADLTQRLDEKAKSLSPAELKAIKQKQTELAAIQEAKEKPENLAKIPHLSRGDLSPDISAIPRELFDAGGIPALGHALWTNGITYTALAFPVDALAPSDYPWLTLFSRAVVSMGLPGRSYAEVSSLLARTVGDFSPILRSGSLAPGAGSNIITASGEFDLGGRDWIIYMLKALDEKAASALDLAIDLITRADFSDQRRLNDVVLGLKNDADSSLAPEGHSYASSRSSLSFSRASVIDEVWNGIFQIEFVHKIAEMETSEIARALTGIRDRLAASGAVVNITGSREAVDASLRLIEAKAGRGGDAASRSEGAAFMPAGTRFGPPRARNPLTQDVASFYALLGTTAADARKPEVFASPALQVGFAARSLSGPIYGSREYTASSVLSHHLSTGALWENIRMKGGAYGAFAHINGMERIFSLSTYRDPNPLRSLDAFTQALKKAHRIDEESLTKAVIGTYAKDTRPQTPSQKGFSDFLRFLCGITDDMRLKIRRDLLDISAKDIAAAAKHLGAQPNVEGQSCILAGTDVAEKTAAKLGVEVKTLPV
jgi:Zn-dependent M16 (insulinase) family peptidase